MTLPTTSQLLPIANTIQANQAFGSLASFPVTTIDIFQAEAS